MDACMMYVCVHACRFVCMCVYIQARVSHACTGHDLREVQVREDSPNDPNHRLCARVLWLGFRGSPKPSCKAK